MLSRNRKPEFRAYISFDPKDSDSAHKLTTFLESSFDRFACTKRDADPSNRPEITAKRVGAIRSSNVFFLLISKNSLDEHGYPKESLRWELAEALNWRKDVRIVLVSLDDPHLFEQASWNKLRSGSPDRRFFVRPEDERHGINFPALQDVLGGIGVPTKTQYEPHQHYDVFISYKSADASQAQEVYEFLRANGMNPFFSKASLPALGSDEYVEAIHQAVENARHMVIVGTSAENVTATWVKYEWRLFLSERLAGRKTGNLVTVVAGGLTVERLPIDLRYREVIQLDPTDIQRLLQYTRSDKEDESDRPGPRGTSTDAFCPNCDEPVQPHWSVCPNCEASLRLLCPNCREPLETKWKLCPHCRNRVLCPSCGARLKKDAKTCADCGSPVSAKPTTVSEDKAGTLEDPLLRDVSLTEAIVLEVFQGKPDVNWTREIVQQLIAGGRPDLGERPHLIADAVERLVQKAFLITDPGKRLHVTRKSIDFYNRKHNASTLNAVETDAFSALHSRSKKGDVEAQLEKGLCYLKGKGVVKNFSQALKWIRRAADQGHPEAKVHLEQMVRAL